MSLSRRVEQFQTKLQQQIDIQDDEISRYARHLGTLQASIVETRDALRRFIAQSEQAKQTSEGARRRRIAHAQSITARLSAEHHSLIQDLVNDHRSELQEMCSEFETALDEIGGWAEGLTKEKIAPVNGQIQQIQKQIAGRKSLEIHDSKDPMETFAEMEHVQSLESQRIQFLETAIRDKNKDRLTSLVQMKQQLADCVSTLEQLDQRHSIQIDKLKSKLEDVEARYKKRLVPETEKHRREVVSARRKLQGVDRRIEEIEKEIAKREQNHLSEMLVVSQSRDQLRMDLKAVSSRPAPSRKEITGSLQLQAKLAKLREDLANEEEILRDERKRNEMLKRESARVRDEARIAQRRAALRL
jgi:DNA-binding protein H-NS